MRVLLTTDTVGGVWTYTRELTEALLHHGCSVALASFGRAPSPEQTHWTDCTTARFGEQFHFFPYALPLEWMDENERVFTDGAIALQDIIDRFAPDLLHTNQFCFGALDVPLPRLVAAHSDVLSWGEACRPLGLERSPWLDRYCDLVQRGLAGASAVVAPTRTMLRALARSFTLPSRQLIIANGRSLPPPLDIPPRRRMQAVTAGRLWDEAKNIGLLTEVHSPMPLVVAGEQSFSATQRAPASANLHFVGALTETQLLTLFWASSVYIAPSIYEPFGLAPLEAALCGCAILANDIPSLREVWSDAALFFSNAAALDLQLHSLAEDPLALCEAQRRAHDRAAKLSRTVMAEQYLSLYRDLKHAPAHTLPEHAIEARGHVA